MDAIPVSANPNRSAFAAAIVNRSTMQDHLEQLHAKALGLRSTALSKVGMTPEDLAKLNMLPLVTGIAGFFVIIIMWGAVMTQHRYMAPAWLRHRAASSARMAFTAGAVCSAAARSKCAAASLSSAAERGPASQAR